MAPKRTDTLAPGAATTDAGGAVFIQPNPAPQNANVWFFTRLGGVSEPPFGSLNISTKVGDSPENVGENLSRIKQAMDGNPSAWVRQVAGDAVVHVSEGGFAGEADALITREENLSLVVGVADCVPVALVGEDAVGMIHSGWRGTLSGISGKAAREMIEEGGRNVSGMYGEAAKGMVEESGRNLMSHGEDHTAREGSLAAAAHEGDHADRERNLAASHEGNLASGGGNFTSQGGDPAAHDGNPAAHSGDLTPTAAREGNFAARGGSIVAYIGPCIRRCCYEVSEELAGKFADEFGEGVVSGRQLSLPDAIRVDLERAGVEEIHDLGMCAGCRPDLFFSHRMEKPVTGRNLASVSMTSKAGA